MSLDSRPAPGRGTKRQRVEAANAGQRQQSGTPQSLSPRGSPAVSPVIRPPDAPFYEGAIQLWVVRDASGKKVLVATQQPGCWHWRSMCL
jgi:hypothetical protein